MLTRLGRRTLLTVGMGAALAMAAPDAFAHGGSHPTPWPSPPGDPTPPPSPTPSPSPSPSPTPSPGKTTPTGAPTSGTGGGLTGPSGPSGPKTSARPSSETLWEQWWKFNQWNYTRVGRRATQVSGEDAGAGAATGDSAAVLFLKTALGDAYYDVRSAACIGLGKSADLTVSDKLALLVDDTNATVQESAILALGMVKHTGNIPQLMRVFENPGKYNVRLQAAAALALGFVGDQAATPRLLEILKRGGDEEVRAAAIVALGLLKDRSAFEPLYEIITRMTGKQNDVVRAYAVTALGKLGIAEYLPAEGKKAIVTAEVLGSLLRADKSDEVQESAVLALGALGDEGNVRELVWALGKARDPMVRNFSMVAAARLAKTDATQAIVRRELEKVLVEGREYTGKGFAALALGLLGDPAAAGILRRTFQTESDPSPKAACAIGLGLLKDKESRHLIASQIAIARDASLRGYCCVALGLIGGDDAVPDLRKILETERNPELCAAAAIALANVGDRASMETLRKSLTDKNHKSYLSMTTVLALGYFRDDAVVPDLVKYFETEKNNEVRAITTVAIGYIADKSDRPILKLVATDFNYLLHYPTIDLVLALH